MDNGSDGQLPSQIGNHTFLEHLGKGAVDHAYLAIDNQGDDDVEALLKLVQSPDPGSAEALRHLQLPNDDFDFQKFIQILRELGYGISSEVAILSRRNTREYTKAIGQDSSRALLYIPKEILLKPSPENLDAITSICSAFTQESVLIVFSKTDEYADSEIRRIIKQDWPNSSHVGRIIPWKDVKTLIDDFDCIKNERSPRAKEQLLGSIKKEIEIMLENLRPTNDL